MAVAQDRYRVYKVLCFISLALYISENPRRSVALLHVFRIVDVAHSLCELCIDNCDSG